MYTKHSFVRISFCIVQLFSTWYICFLTVEFSGLTLIIYISLFHVSLCLWPTPHYLLIANYSHTSLILSSSVSQGSLPVCSA